MARWTQALGIVAVAAVAIGLLAWGYGGDNGERSALAPAVADTSESLNTKAAVVDLDAVAKAIGRDEEITQQIEAAVAEINEELRQAAQQMQEQLQQEQEQLGEDPDEEQVARLRQMALQARQAVQNNRAAAEIRRDRVRAELVREFREEARPIAEQVARERGANVVLLANDNVLWYESTADITGAVITQMRAR